MYIEKINGPEDVKKLNIEEMTALAEEMRHALLKRASIHGGHFMFLSPQRTKWYLMFPIRPIRTRC